MVVNYPFGQPDVLPVYEVLPGTRGATPVYIAKKGDLGAKPIRIVKQWSDPKAEPVYFVNPPKLRGITFGPGPKPVYRVDGVSA